MDSSIFQMLFDWFNTREIATGIWLLAMLVGLILWGRTRLSLIQVYRAMLHWKLLVMFGSLALHVGALCWMLSLVGGWDINQAGSTTLWFFMSGVVFLGRSLSTKEDDLYFKKLFGDSLTIGAVFEFVVVAHTFELIIELLFVPVFALLGFLVAVAQSKDEFRRARIFIETIMLVVVLALLWHSISGILADPSAFFSERNGRNFLLPIFLTIGSIPFIYIWYCISSMGNAFIQIDFKKARSELLRKCAKQRFFWQFFLEPSLLKRAVRQFNLTPVSDPSDVASIVREIRSYERNAKCPPIVDDQEGWSPYFARDFLSAYGLRTSDYHAIFDGTEWMASSPYVDLDGNIISSTASFYFEGRREIVNTLKLSGSFYKEFATDEALNKFANIMVLLAASALDIPVDAAADIFPEEAPFEITKDGTRLSSEVKEHPNDKGFYWHFVLSRPVDGQ